MACYTRELIAFITVTIILIGLAILFKSKFYGSQCSLSSSTGASGSSSG